MNENSAIGFFDSGLGGLTAVRELKKLLPSEDIIYFGDTGRVPYGTKSKETIIKYAGQDISFLESLNVKFIIAACGTVSSFAEFINKPTHINFTGVVKPTAQAAAKLTKNGKIGVIGTTATVKSQAYSKTLAKINPKFNVFEQACPLFVPLIESGMEKSDAVLTEIARRYIEPLKATGIDTLILGCTHYPLIWECISQVIGQRVKLVNSGKETAIAAMEKLKESGLLRDNQIKGNCHFYVSDEAKEFALQAEKFLEWCPEYKVCKIDIERF